MQCGKNCVKNGQTISHQRLPPRQSRQLRCGPKVLTFSKEAEPTLEAGSVMVHSQPKM
jgi:hypothetical protein